jgi:hypothetical protein
MMDLFGRAAKFEFLVSGRSIFSVAPRSAPSSNCISWLLLAPRLGACRICTALSERVREAQASPMGAAAAVTLAPPRAAVPPAALATTSNGPAASDELVKPKVRMLPAPSSSPPPPRSGA